MKFKPTNWVAAIAAGVTFIFSGEAKAIDINFSNVNGAGIEFTGTGDTFQFQNDTVSGNGFRITSVVPDGIPSAVGFFGTITGVFKVGAITTIGFLQTASVTTLGPTAVLTISDGTFNLTADIQMVSIFSNGATGGLNAGTVANLSNFSYAGTNSSLISWMNGIGPSGSITYQFNSTTSLKNLTTNGKTFRTSYSGTLSSKSVPETGSSLAILGLSLIGLAVVRRKMVTA